MAAVKNNSQFANCEFVIGDVFTNGDGHFIVSNIVKRSGGTLLKEPLYTLERFPDKIIKDGKIILELKPFDAYESEIKRQCTFNWEKVE